MHMCNSRLFVQLLLLSFLLSLLHTGLQLLQLSLSIAQQHLQGAAVLWSDHLNTKHLSWLVLFSAVDHMTV